MELPGFAPACGSLSSLGLELPTDIWHRVASIIQPIDLAELGANNPAPKAVVDAWKSTLDHTSVRDSIAWIILLLFFKKQYESANDPLRKVLENIFTQTGRRMTLEGTRTEVELRLGARLYEEGRKRISSREQRDTARRLLEASIASCDSVESGKRALRDEVKRRYRGMRGVALLLLARADVDPMPRLTAASVCLEESGRLGDSSPEHYEYLLECYLRRYDLSEDQNLLAQAEETLLEAGERCPQSRGLFAAQGEIALRRGFQNAKYEQWGQALSSFQVAVESFSNALECHANLELKDEYILVKRGQALLRIYTTQHSLGSPDDGKLLDRALEDIQTAEGHSLPTGGVSFAFALFLRSIPRRKQREYQQACEDLEKALSVFPVGLVDSESVELNSRIRGSIAECNVWMGLEKADEAQVEDGCRALMGTPHEGEASIAALAHGVRFLALRLPWDKARTWLEEAADYIEARLGMSDVQGDARSFAASHAAQFLFLLAKEEADRAKCERAYALYRESISTRETPAAHELYGHAGETALYLGKQYVSLGEDEIALGFLEDAVEFLSVRISIATDSGDSSSETSSAAIAHSKLGEAFVRLHALTGRDEHATNAISHLTTARSLGNETPELMGVLGDVYYRRGRARRNSEDLQNAVALKQAAKEAGHTSRENRSVCATAFVHLWVLTQDVANLTRAIKAACEAVDVDPSWPWPFFQLSEIAAVTDSVRQEAVGQMLADCQAHDLVERIRNGDSAGLERLGCERAVHSKEFEKDVLGGRQKAYVLDDPHRLLSSTLVLKPTLLKNAERERNVTTQFRTFLTESGAPEYFSLPNPLAIIPFEGDRVIYIMRRANGRQLGGIVLDWLRGHGGHPRESFKRALEFLAYFHAWKLQKSGKIVHTLRTNLIELSEEIARSWEALGLPDSEARGLSQALVETVPPRLPAIPKKDAHPENWLVGPNRELVMLDLEATASRPLFFEVAQLVEDYPLFETSEAGWQARVELCEEYSHALRCAGSDVTEYDQCLPTAYSSFALFRAAFGLARLMDRRGKGLLLGSSSALRATIVRERHLRLVISFLAKRGPNDAVKKCASWIETEVLGPYMSEATADLSRR